MVMSMADVAPAPSEIASRRPVRKPVNSNWMEYKPGGIAGNR
jgi:hypothetical protein